MSQWKTTLEKQRALYEEYKKDFLKLGLSSNASGDSSRPSRLKGQGWWEYEEPKERPAAQKELTEEEPAKGTPKATQGESQHVSFVEQRKRAEAERAALPEEERKRLEAHEHNVELRETIWKDVQRTHPGMHFFADTRCEIMERILFIYAKLNPAIEYVQGMNEVLAPILYVSGLFLSLPSSLFRTILTHFSCNRSLELRALIRMMRRITRSSPDSIWMNTSLKNITRQTHFSVSLT